MICEKEEGDNLGIWLIICCLNIMLYCCFVCFLGWFESCSVGRLEIIFFLGIFGFLIIDL